MSKQSGGLLFIIAQLETALMPSIAYLRLNVLRFCNINDMIHSKGGVVRCQKSVNNSGIFNRKP